MKITKEILEKELAKCKELAEKRKNEGQITGCSWGVCADCAVNEFLAALLKIAPVPMGVIFTNCESSCGGGRRCFIKGCLDGKYHCHQCGVPFLLNKWDTGIALEDEQKIAQFRRTRKLL